MNDSWMVGLVGKDDKQPLIRIQSASLLSCGFFFLISSFLSLDVIKWVYFHLHFSSIVSFCIPLSHRRLRLLSQFLYVRRAKDADSELRLEFLFSLNWRKSHSKRKEKKDEKVECQFGKKLNILLVCLRYFLEF